MSEIQTIKVACKQVQVTLEDVKGKQERCTVREMTGGADSDYRDAIAENVEYEIGPDGQLKVTGIRRFAGMEATLLSRSLFHEEGKAFSEEEVRRLSASAQKRLFEIAQELNAASEEGKTKAKNDSKARRTGSG